MNIRINKIDKNLFYAGVIFIFMSFILTGCNDLFEQLENYPEGMGAFSLIISDEGRTILPVSPILNDYAVFNLSFTPLSGGAAVNADRTNETLASSPVYLEPGIYYLTVNAYKDSEKNQLTAQGTADSVTISSGNLTKVSVTLKALLSGGTGTFRWNISFPVDAAASMIITPLNAGGTAQQTVALTSSAEDRVLNSGLYNLTFNLQRADGKTIVWRELLHVYRNLDSVFNHTFTNAHFSNSNYTVTYKYNDGIISDAAQSILHGETAARPSDPSRSGYIFRGWHTDNNTFANSWNFIQPVIESLTLYAKWEGVPSEGVTLDKTSIVLTVDDTETLIATVWPVNAPNKNVTWSSNNPDIAVDNNGKITALSIGTAVITATAQSGGEPATCTVRVFYPEHSERYIAVPYAGTDKIKYSYTYDGYDFYYIYLGELSLIPMFTGRSYPHTGSPQTLKFSQSTSTQISFEESVSNSSSEAVSIINEHTNSTTTGAKVSVEASAKVGVPFAKAEVKTYAEATWTNHVTNTTTNSFQQTTSLTTSKTFAASETNTILQDHEKSLNQHNRPGSYRYTMFSSSDVYLYVIRNSETNEFYCELKEFVINNPPKLSWVWDFSETGYFGKTDESNFELDLSILDNLPEPELVFNADGLAFTLINGNAYSVFNVESTAANVIIPSVCNGYPVTSIAANGFRNYEIITSIVIPSSVKNIGNNAFNGCTNLKTVYYGGADITVWNGITIGTGNNSLVNAARYYYSETQPTEGNTNWRYLDGVPKIYYIGMAQIPAGTLKWGNATITLSAFKMGKYQVTQEQYQAVMGLNPSGFNSNPMAGEIQDKRPVEQISWYDIIVFCNRLSVMEGLTPAYRINNSINPDTWGSVPTANNATWNAVEIISESTGYRLPTEAQWEYACRAGTTTNWYFGSTESDLTKYAWYEANSSNRTHQVGLKTASDWGLCDMYGNVWEWVWDWQGNYPTSNQTDYKGPSSGNYRVLRGGNYADPTSRINSAYRLWIGSSHRDSNVGFRVVRP